MKKILIIGSKTTDDGETEQMGQYAAFFAGQLEDAQVSFVHFDELSFVISSDEYRIKDHRNGLSLDEYNLIIFRGKIRSNSELAYCISRFCVQKNITFLNDYTPYRAASKVAQAVTFCELNVPSVKTVYASQPTILKEVISSELTFPFVLKDSYGAHGHDNYLVKSQEELEEILAHSPAVKFIAQSFFPNKCDYRILCVGDKELVIRRSAVGDSHLNNTSQGGKAELVPSAFFPAQAMQEAHTIANFLKMNIAGVDLLYNEETKQYAFLEVNSQPQLKSGAFPEEKQKLVSDFLRTLLH